VRIAYGAALAATLLVAACGGSGRVAAPLPPSVAVTTTITGYTESQVLGWVAPTLNNGIAFVVSVPPNAPYTRLLRAAQSLSTACTVAQNELNEVSWVGQALLAKTILESTLTQTVALVTSPSPPSFAGALANNIHVISTDLSALERAV